MKKMIRSKLVQVLFLVIAITGASLAYKAYHKHELTQFVMWSPRAKMMDYEFIANHKAVAISWDNEAELKEAKEAKKYDPRIDIRNDRIEINGERFIIRQSYKLKSAAYKYWLSEKDKVPYLKSNIPEKGEYWFLDVYDTKGNTIKQKTYDVFKMVREYNKNYVPINVADFSKVLQSEGEKTYLPIKMAVNSKSNSKTFIGIIDIETGKIISKTSTGKTGKDFYDVNQKAWQNKEGLEDLLDQNDKLSNKHFNFVWSAFWFTKKVQADSLASKYPKVYDILSKGSLSELYFLGTEDVRLKISFLKLVVPKGENIFKNLTIPESSSKDGKEHIVQNEEEFLEYYQSNLGEK